MFTTLRQILLTNFWWKLVALVSATTIWITFHSSENHEFHWRNNPSSTGSTRDFPRHRITVMKTATDPRNFTIEPQEVDITVSGELNILTNLSGKDIRAFVDLTEIGENQNSIRIQVYSPRGVRLERVTPRDAQLSLVNR